MAFLHFCACCIDEVVVAIDPRHGRSKPLTEDEVREQSEKRREAYLDFVAELDAASPEIEVCDIADEGITLQA